MSPSSVSRSQRALFSGALACTVFAGTCHAAPIATAPVSVQATDSPGSFPLPRAVKPSPALLAKVEQLADDSLKAMAEKSDEKDSQWYEAGIWHNSAEKVWQVQSGPAALAAVLWQWREKRAAVLSPELKARQAWLRQVAIETMDRHIKDQVREDGSFNPAGTHVQFFMEDLGLVYLSLQDTLDAATKQRWQNALTGQIAFWMKNGDLPDPSKPSWKATDGWTTNGNVELSEAHVLYVAWKITGDAKYQDLFERQWKHTLVADKARWPEYGLFHMKSPTQPDGSDGSGYIAEAEQVPGFDPAYTQLQLAINTRLFVLSRDARLLRVSNLLLNALWPRVDQKTWVLDATYGSRHSERPPFASPAPAVLTWLGGRTEFAPLLEAQFDTATAPLYLRNAVENKGSPGEYRGYGLDPATLLLAAMAAGA